MTKKKSKKPTIAQLIRTIAKLQKQVATLKKKKKPARKPVPKKRVTKKPARKPLLKKVKKITPVRRKTKIVSKRKIKPRFVPRSSAKGIKRILKSRKPIVEEVEDTNEEMDAATEKWLRSIPAFTSDDRVETLYDVDFEEVLEDDDYEDRYPSAAWG